MKKILLLGERSFAATGLYKLLVDNGYHIDCFSRGTESRKDDHVRGNVYKISQNRFLSDEYDVVINFIVIKNGSIDENIKFIKEVDRLCQQKKVSNLLQISSISVYPHRADHIDETSEIELDPSVKGNYGSVKIAVDRFLEEKKPKYSVSYLRPGYIYTNDANRASNISGIGINILNSVAIILGNKSTPLTLIERQRFHEAILRIIKSESKKKCYLLFENNNSTKKDFLKRCGYKIIIGLNSHLIISISFFLKFFGVIDRSKLQQIKSLFRKTRYSNYTTEYELDYSIIINSYCIIGAGTYGSYIANKISKTNPGAHITVFDVGNKIIKSEDQIGYKTNILKDNYFGTSKGRFFGFGGASTKWGGQLLTFSDNDFANPDGFLKDIVKYNEKHRKRIFKKFSIQEDFSEKKIEDNLFIKTGIWLNYFRRDLFKYFKVSKIKNLKIEPNARITKILSKNNYVRGLEFIKNGKKYKARFDNYFLTAGAFESFRILLNSKLISSDIVNFSDHLSRKSFVINGSTIIGEDDFAFRIKKSSLITKRIIGEIDGVSFYFNPKFNDHFPFFQNLKALLFKREFKINLLWSVISDSPSFLAFLWSILVKKKIYTYKNKWYVDIDVENPKENSFIKISEEIDAYSEPAVDLFFVKNEHIDNLYKKINLLIKNYLDKHNVNYQEIEQDFQVTKTEDTYHPYGMLENVESVDDYFKLFKNLLIVNTGILPRAGGINTAAAVFPLIEEYVDRIQFQIKSN
jgi:nucleoside-diphosphate-sugar epimerase